MKRPTTEEQVEKYLLEKVKSEQTESGNGLYYLGLAICVLVAIESVVGYYASLWLIEMLHHMQRPFGI